MNKFYWFEQFESVSLRINAYLQHSVSIGYQIIASGKGKSMCLPQM
jgi:hypothetical protein